MKNKYEPSLNVQDFPSRGIVSRIYGDTCSRKHVFFSQLEKDFFLIADYDKSILDIQEQYPLKLKLTQKIAHSLGYRHPRKIGTQQDNIMTTDFLLTKEAKNGDVFYLARSVKTLEDFKKKRTREKLEIEAQYWKLHDIDFRIVTEDSLNPILVKNVTVLKNLPPIELEMKVLLPYFKNDFLGNSQPLNLFFKQFELYHNLESGTSKHLYRHLLKRHEIEMDLTQEYI